MRAECGRCGWFTSAWDTTDYRYISKVGFCRPCWQKFSPKDRAAHEIRAADEMLAAAENARAFSKARLNLLRLQAEVEGDA